MTREQSLEPALPAKNAGTALPLLMALRPKQWVKNLVLSAGILFTLDQGHPISAWLRVIAAVCVFCALSSAIYLVNDVCDLEQDRRHPRKRYRPIAAGTLSVGTALAAAVLLALGGLGAAALLGRDFALASAAYVVLTLGYSLRLKHVVVIDVMALASFYVIRAVAGAVVLPVEISPWLVTCTTFGALLLGFAKRRSELVTLDEASSHRRILEEYSVAMLDQMIVVMTACTLTAYMLYTFFSPTGQHQPLMMLTIPYVIYGLFRFLYLMHRHGKGGEPSSDLIEDRSLLLCGVLWALTCALVIFYQ
jgi:4-hydroxybenzoate polyprenyltransferase